MAAKRCRRLADPTLSAPLVEPHTSAEQDTLACVRMVYLKAPAAPTGEARSKVPDLVNAGWRQLGVTSRMRLLAALR